MCRRASGCRHTVVVRPRVPPHELGHRRSTRHALTKLTVFPPLRTHRAPWRVIPLSHQRWSKAHDATRPEISPRAARAPICECLLGRLKSHRDHGPGPICLAPVRTRARRVPNVGQVRSGSAAPLVIVVAVSSNHLDRHLLAFPTSAARSASSPGMRRLRPTTRAHSREVGRVAAVCSRAPPRSAQGGCCNQGIGTGHRWWRMTTASRASTADYLAGRDVEVTHVSDAISPCVQFWP